MKLSLREAMNRVRSFFHKRPLDGELDEELVSHVDLAVEENLRFGMTPEEARRQALIRFGGVQQARERQREARGLPWLDVLLQDLRYTFRTLRRDRGFACVAILILALGIGSNVAVFSVVNTILLRPLPFQNSPRLVWIANNDGHGGLSEATYSVDAYEDYGAQNRTLSAVSGYNPFYGDADFTLTGHGEPQPVSGVLVAGNFFEVLGVQPMLGRLFVSEEYEGKNPRSAVLLSYPFWRRQFAGNPKIVGQAIRLNDSPVVVAGVLPASFDFGAVFAPGTRMDIFMPGTDDLMRDWGNTLALVGRMKPGVTIAQVQAEAAMLFPHYYWNKKQPNSIGAYKHTIAISLKDCVSGKLRRSLIVLWCAVGVILLIVCVNLSNLLLGRTAARNREFAMRSALGAGRARLLRQLLTESLVLSGAGGLLGLGTAYGVVVWLAHQGSLALPLLNEVRVDTSALAWTLLIAAGAAVLCGLAPGLRFSTINLQDALKDGGHGASAGRQHDRTRATLVVSEVALACVLLVGAGLLLRSFLRVMDVDLGFDPSRTAAIEVTFDDGGQAARRGPIFEEMLRRVGAIPGIQAAGISDVLPLDHNRSWGLWAQGPAPATGSGAFVQVVTPGYFHAMGIRLWGGRDFDWNDKTNSQKVVIINQSAARRYWPGQDPVGRIAEPDDRRVIGVVADVRQTSAETDSGPEMYVPITQEGPEGAELVVRTSLPPDVLAKSVMSTLRSMNPGQPATEFRPIQVLVDHAVSPRRFFVLLVGVFAGLGLLLAMLGIYGVISYSVTRQTQEIGIRMALGASRGRVQLGVLARTMRLALLGIGAGVIASLGVAQLIGSLLFGTQPTDPAIFAAMAGLLVMVALLAGYLPARRASRVDPMIALRTN
jgi:predicted permease